MTVDICLTNFRCWESKNISIPSSGLCLINGRSGKGKSTILNSILYVVTGKIKNITTINKKSTKVSIKIDNMTITRSRGPNRLTLEKDDKLYENDDAQAIINSLFGEEFANTSYIDQDNMNSFVSLSPSDKMEFLEKLLLTNYDINNIKEKIRIEISNTKSQHTTEESKQNTLESLIKTMRLIEQDNLTIDKIKINKINFSKIFEKIKSNYDISEKNIKTLKIKIKKLEEEQLLFSKYIEQRKKLDFQIEDIESNPLYKEINTIESLILSLESLEESKNYYLKNKEYMFLNEKFEELTKKYKNLQESGNKEKEYLQKEIQKYNEISILRNISKTRLLELQKCLDLIDNIAILEEDLTGDINFEQEIETEQNKYNSYNDLLLKKKQLLSNLEKSYVCPSCNKFLKIQNEKLILSQCVVETNIPSLKSEIEELKEFLRIAELAIQTHKKNQIIYQQKEEKYNSLFDKLDLLRKDIECDKEKILEEVDFMNNNLKTIDELTKKLNLLDNDKLIDDIKKELSILTIKLSKFNTNIFNITNNFINNDIEYEDCIKKISFINEKIIQIKKLDEKHSFLTKELDSIKDNNKENKNYSELLKIEREKIETYSDKLDTYKLYIDQLNLWERNNKENEKYNELKENIELCYLNKQKLSDRLRCLVKLREHVKNAEQKCISDFIDSLNEHASIYMEYFFPDEDIKVELKTTQETKSTGKEKISLNFSLTYRQINGDLSYLSGGERDRVNLAFTLAFSEIINNRVLLLDECISSLDAETTSIVLENIKEKYKGKLVILVSHQANLGFFDKVIDI
jgi:DNA repair exonuclease SbcCD ATPase subunit